MIPSGNDHPITVNGGTCHNQFRRPGGNGENLGCNMTPHARFGVIPVQDDGARDVRLHAEAYQRSELLREFERHDDPARTTILRIVLALRSPMNDD
jgi:hypothetical protein